MGMVMGNTCDCRTELVNPLPLPKLQLWRSNSTKKCLSVQINVANNLSEKNENFDEKIVAN